MHFLDESRPKLANSRPAWRDAQFIALPWISLQPDAGGTFIAEILLPTPLNDSGFEYVPRHGLRAEEIPNMLLEWADDPEIAVIKWFGRNAPRTGAKEMRVSVDLSNKGVVDI